MRDTSRSLKRRSALRAAASNDAFCRGLFHADAVSFMLTSHRSATLHCLAADDLAGALASVGSGVFAWAVRGGYGNLRTRTFRMVPSGKTNLSRYLCRSTMPSSSPVCRDIAIISAGSFFSARSSRTTKPTLSSIAADGRCEESVCSSSLSKNASLHVTMTRAFFLSATTRTETQHRWNLPRSAQRADCCLPAPSLPPLLRTTR